jgi:hypothetical protein
MDAWADTEPTDQPTNQTESQPDISLMAGALAALEDAVSTLREQLARAEQRADRAESATASERTRADAEQGRLVAQIVDLQRDLDRARSEALEALQRSEAMERAETNDRRGGSWRVSETLCGVAERASCLGHGRSEQDRMAALVRPESKEPPNPEPLKCRKPAKRAGLRTNGCFDLTIAASDDPIQRKDRAGLRVNPSKRPT